MSRENNMTLLDKAQKLLIRYLFLTSENVSI